MLQLLLLAASRRRRRLKFMFTFLQTKNHFK